MLLLKPHRLRQALPYCVAAVVAGLALFAILTVFASPSSSTSLLTPEVIARQLCASVPVEARVTAAQAAATELRVVVPDEIPAVNVSPTSVQARKGDVVRITVGSTTDGAVGVHGLSDIVPIRSGQQVGLAFRLIYSGRFPLHFHGVGGSHFEILAFEVHD